MKTIQQLKARFIPCAMIIFIVFLLAGCFSPLLSKDTSDTQKKGVSSTLRINVGSGNPSSRTIFPTTSIDLYTVVLTPAAGNVITESNLIAAGSILTVDSVPDGTYTVRITGYDLLGAKISEGSQTGVVVSSASLVLSMTLVPIMTAGGTGTLDLEIDIPDYSADLAASVSSCKVSLLSYPVATGSEVPWAYTNADYSSGVLQVSETGIKSGKYLLKIVFTIGGVDYLRVGDLVYIGDDLGSVAVLSCPIKDLVDASSIYYVTKTGAGDGRTAALPCTLAKAFASINASSAITPTNPAKIYLLENFLDTSATSYNIVKPVVLSSVLVPSPYSIQKSTSQASFPLFSIGTNGTLTLEDVTIAGCMGNSSLVNVGSGGNFIMAMGSVLTGNDNSGTASGGAVTVNAGMFEMQEGTISGCSAMNGGAVYVASGTFKMNGGQIGSLSPVLPNKAMGDGGAVYLMNGSFEMYDGSIAGNETLMNGGGLWVSSSSIATISGGSIYKNMATVSGGGVFVNGGIFKMPAGSSSVINGNSATVSGGGVYSAGAQTLVLSGGTIGGSSSSDMNMAAVNGGGLYLGYAATPSTVTLDGTKIQFNKASNGGGLYINSTMGSSLTASVSGTNITDNIASGNGGGVFVNLSSVLLLSKSSIKRNQATIGGGIFANDLSSQVATVSISSTNVIISTNTATNFAGGVCLGSKSSFSAPSSVWNSVIYINNAKISNLADLARYTDTFSIDTQLKNACLYGNPSGNSSPPVIVVPLYIPINSCVPVNSTIDIHVSCAIGGTGTLQRGGTLTSDPLFTVNSDGPLSLNDSIILDGASIICKQPLVYVSLGSTLNMYDSAVLKNNFNVFAGTVGTDTGGAVCVYRGTFNMYGGAINNNQAAYGGGVYVEGGTFNMLGSTAVVYRNTASYITDVLGGEGGGLCVVDGFAYLKDGLIGSLTAGNGNSSNNSGMSNAVGGGVYCVSTGLDQTAAQITIEATKIMHNSTEWSGSGIYLASGTLNLGSLTLDDGISANNSVFLGADNIYGAAVWCDAGVVIGETECNRVITGNTCGGVATSIQYHNDNN